MNYTESFSPNFKKFFDWSVEYLEKHGREAVIVNKPYIVKDGVKCGGWCDCQQIVAAFKNPLFEEVYVHEFSHMQQCIQKSPYWKDTSLFWHHLEKDKVTMKSWNSIYRTILLERDCEKRALAHSKKWNLFNNSHYAKRSNTYLHYYQYVFLKRKWLNSVVIYHPMILELMPDKLKSEKSFEKIDMELMKLFDDCLSPRGKYKNKILK